MFENVWLDEATAEDAAERLEGLRTSALATATRLMGDRSSAEDVVQEAYSRALSGLSALRDPRSLAGWFRRIVVHCAMNALSARREAENTEAEAMVVPGDGSIAVRLVLAQLKPDHQAVLALAFGDGLSYKEIAETLGVPMGTVASRVHAAKAAFRAVWGGQDE